MGGDQGDMGFADNDDGDDFFGGGNKFDEDEYVAKKKNQNNDPLAFLQRAQEEKQKNAERKLALE
jgi:hypothetical protein